MTLNERYSSHRLIPTEKYTGMKSAFVMALRQVGKLFETLSLAP